MKLGHMNTLTRILIFGSVSGLLWSVVAGFLGDLFGSSARTSATLIAGIISGVVTSGILSWFVTRFSRVAVVFLGLLSLPLGAFVFGFSFPFVNGTGSLRDAWMLAVNFALISVISVFAVALFPLAVTTTLLLRSFIIRGRGIANVA